MVNDLDLHPFASTSVTFDLYVIDVEPKLGWAYACHKFIEKDLVRGLLDKFLRKRSKSD